MSTFSNLVSERQNQRKANTDKVESSPKLKEPIEECPPREQMSTLHVLPSDELVSQLSEEMSTTDSFLPAEFDFYGTGIHSPSLSDGVGFTISGERNCIFDSDPNFFLSSSSVLPISPANTSPESNTDQSISTLVSSVCNSRSSSNTASEIVDNKIGVAGTVRRDPIHGYVTLLGIDNGLALANSRTFSKAGEKPVGSWQNYLHIAANKGFDRIVRVLLKHNIDCDEKDSDGITPLIHATIAGHEDVVISLLLHGAAIAVVDSQYQRSALHWAIVHRRDDLLKVLLEYCLAQEMAIDMCDNTGRTPLHMAVDMGFDFGVNLLL